VKGENGDYRISSRKICITYDEHDLAENIIHLALARLAEVNRRIADEGKRRPWSWRAASATLGYSTASLGGLPQRRRSRCRLGAKAGSWSRLA
jgi:hypothetical protein